MEDYETTAETSIGVSLFALIVSVIVFVAFWIIGGIGP